MSLAQSLAITTHPAADTGLGEEVRNGLTATPKTLSPWLFYDAPGSALFEQITALPEYYVTRTERAIFRDHAPEILREAAAGHTLAAIELGAGTASKTGLLLEAAAAQQGSIDYHAIDVSASALDEAREHLERELTGVRVHTRVADYTDGLGQINVPGCRRLVLYIGSSIGNFEPAAAAQVLSAVRKELAPGDQLLLGADQVKDIDTLHAAYDDRQGVTAAFNKNVLRRINDELGADFNLELFRHQARWNPEASRIEMHLQSTRAQIVHIPGLHLELRFAAGESIHTENSYKFTDASITTLLTKGGFRIHRTWKDPKSWFGVYLAEAI